jgi:hypothetical protein
MFNKKKKYYNRIIQKTQESIWDMGLRIETIQEIREGIRREYDRIVEAIGVYTQKLTELFTELGLPVEKIELLEKTRYLLKPEDTIGLNPEGKKKAESNASEETRRMREAVLTSEVVNNSKDRTTADSKKTIADVIKIIELKEGLETDAEHMKEQMLGKWIESEAKRVGGIDQEIEDVKSKIEGGEMFKQLVEKKMRND